MNGRRIIIRTDDRELSELLIMWLGDAGYETATDGDGALHIVDSGTRGEFHGDKILWIVYEPSGHKNELLRPFTHMDLTAAVRDLCGDASGELLCDDAGRRVIYRGDAVTLTAKEYEVMRLLYDRGEAGATREEIAAVARREGGGRETNAGDVYVHHLRRKLEGLTGQRLIKTVRGVGYVLSRG